MHSIEFSVVFFAVAVTICWGRIIIKHSESTESSQLAEAVVNCLEGYYENRGKAVGLAGPMPGSIYQSLSEKLIPVTLLDAYRTKAYKNEFSRWEKCKLDVFIVTTTSITHFNEKIHLIKSSKWWNPVAQYLIVEWSSAEKNGCTDSEKYLYKAWENNMINARVICQKSMRGVKLYGYNPYTDEAPKTWKLERNFSGKKFPPFAVFSQDYQNSSTICQTVGANLMTKLAGYKIYIAEDEFTVVNVKSQKSKAVLFLEFANVFQLLASTLNATLVYHTVPTRVNKEASYLEHLARKYMVTLPVATLHHYRHPVLTFSYTTKRSEFYAVTHFKGHLTQLQKILSVTDIDSRIGLCLVLLLTILFFKYFVRHSIIGSSVNVCRIVCNTGFMNIPNHLWAKLYIGPVLLFAVVMQGIYQGNFATLLTQTLPIRDAMTMQDLADYGYTIYALKEIINIMLDKAMFNGRLVSDTFANCHKPLSENPMAACIDFEPFIKDLAWDLKLHVVGQTVGVMDLTFCLPTDTHLEDKINQIFQTILEAGISVPLNFREQDRKVSEFEFDEEVKRNKSFKAISLGELEFAFVILGIGFFCATMTFIGELAFDRYHSRTRKARIQFFN